MVTKKGTVKRVHLPEFQNITESGLIAIALREGDELLDVQITSGRREILLTSRGGFTVRFDEEEAREIGRNTQGVIGMEVREGDEVVSLTNVPKADLRAEPTGSARHVPLILTATEKGLGKLTRADDYRKTSRGALGVRAVSKIERTGKIVTMIHVSKDMEALVITRSGMAIRIAVEGVCEQGRNSMGVRMIRLQEGDAVAGVERFVPQEE
jgi:DNA gyrase subunit A